MDTKEPIPGDMNSENPVEMNPRSRDVLESVGEVEDVKEIVGEEREPREISASTMTLIASDMKSRGAEVSQKHQRVWSERISSADHIQLEKAYHQISPKNLVFFDVADQKLFIEQTRQNYEMLRGQYQRDTIKRWDEKEMDRMFGKGLNPTSLITSLESAEWFVENLPSHEDPIVLELGPGAGWSTIMLYDSLKEKVAKPKVISCDQSAHAIAATQTLCEYRNIPYVVAGTFEELDAIRNWFATTPEGKDFSGVVLVLDEFNDLVRKLPQASVDGVYSSHGTAYVSEVEYLDLLTSLQSALKPGGIFIADSLNPLFTNKLSKALTIAQMLMPDRIQSLLTKRGVKYMEDHGVSLKSKSKYFQGQDVTVLKGFNIPHAYLIFRWSNYLIRNLEIKRFLDTKTSLEVTMDVVEAYRDDVYPSYLLKDLVAGKNLKFSNLEGRPDFPIFMDTQGFRLNN